VRAAFGHTDALRLPALWEGEPFVWLVDAVMRRSRPGTVHRLSHEELLSVPQRHGTAHQLSLPESLRCVALSCPDMQSVRYRLWGIEPARLALGCGLTESVAAAVGAVAREIEREASRVRESRHNPATAPVPGRKPVGPTTTEGSPHPRRHSRSAT